MKTDWVSIRDAYRAGQGSYRQLARQFGVSEHALKQRGYREGWVALRQKARTEGAETEGSGEARTERFLTVSDKLLDKVALLTDREELLTAANLKTLSDVMKNIKEVQMIRSPKEQLELELRIEKLKKDNREGSDTTAITVQLEQTAEYAR